MIDQIDLSTAEKIWQGKTQSLYESDDYFIFRSEKKSSFLYHLKISFIVFVSLLVFAFVSSWAMWMNHVPLKPILNYFLILPFIITLVYFLILGLGLSLLNLFESETYISKTKMRGYKILFFRGLRKSQKQILHAHKPVNFEVWGHTNPQLRYLYKKEKHCFFVLEEGFPIEKIQELLN